MDNWNPMHSTTVQEIEEYMKSLGWQPKISFKERIGDMVRWSMKNDKWLK